ncbi:MAG: hypothetical protein ACK40G_11125 [Cytophagaceae bacterium]
MNKHYFFLIGLISFLAGSSCTKKADPDLSDYEFFPIESGNFVVYEVEKIVYTPNNIQEEHFFLKEKIAEEYTAGNETKFRVERYTKKELNEPWPVDPDSVWAVLYAPNRIVKVESNMRYVKLMFPLAEGKIWNGNSENIAPVENYKITGLKRPYTVNNRNFNQSLRVTQSDEFNKIKKNSKMEVYARGVGMVHKSIEIYEYDQDFIGDYKIKSGLKYVEKIVEHGKE